MPRDIQGVIAMLVTPFTQDYQLDEGALRAEVDWCVQNGANGIVATPSIGEFLHLSNAERIRAFEVTFDQARKHKDVVRVMMRSSSFRLTTGGVARRKYISTTGWLLRLATCPWWYTTIPHCPSFT